jgi:hypothetical protein
MNMLVVGGMWGGNSGIDVSGGGGGGAGMASPPDRPNGENVAVVRKSIVATKNRRVEDAREKQSLFDYLLVLFWHDWKPGNCRHTGLDFSNLSGPQWLLFGSQDKTHWSQTSFRVNALSGKTWICFGFGFTFSWHNIFFLRHWCTGKVK